MRCHPEQQSHLDKISKMPKLKVGDKLYDYSLKEYTVSSIGRKYAGFKESRRVSMRLDNFMATSNSWQNSFRLYADKQDIIDEIEHHNLIQKIRKYFSMWEGKNPTLDQLRRVDEIISENSPETKE